MLRWVHWKTDRIMLESAAISERAIPEFTASRGSAVALVSWLALSGMMGQSCGKRNLFPIAGRGFRGTWRMIGRFFRRDVYTLISYWSCDHTWKCQWKWYFCYQVITLRKVIASFPSAFHDIADLCLFSIFEIIDHPKRITFFLSSFFLFSLGILGKVDWDRESQKMSLLCGSVVGIHIH